jgi:hypothetical protein
MTKNALSLNQSKDDGVYCKNEIIIFRTKFYYHLQIWGLTPTDLFHPSLQRRIENPVYAWGAERTRRMELIA